MALWGQSGGQWHVLPCGPYPVLESAAKAASKRTQRNSVSSEGKLQSLDRREGKKSTFSLEQRCETYAVLYTGAVSF